MSTSKNPFDLLNDDDEGELTGPAPAKEIRKEEPKKAPPKGDKKDAPVASKNSATSGGRPDDKTGPAASGRGAKAPRDQDPNGRSKRQFERHSGTGRGRAADGQEDKRGGSGKYNWGSKAAGTLPEDEAQDRKEMTEEEKEVMEAAALEKKKEDEQMSLDEYLKQKKESQDGLGVLAPRQPVALDMKGLQVLVKEEEELVLGENKDAGKGKGKRSGRKVELITDLNFTTPPVVRDSPGRPRGGRGGGGGGGGGGGRGGERGPRGPRGGGQGNSAAANISLTDDSAFPSLAA